MAVVGEKKAGHHQVFHPSPPPIPKPTLPQQQPPQPFIVQQLHTSRFVIDLAARRAAPRQKRQRFKKREIDRKNSCVQTPSTHRESLEKKKKPSAGEDCRNENLFVSSRLHDVNVNGAQRFLEG